ncbi:methyltransferase domain-containing protein [Paenibacillus sp. LMG 31456]|uniref:Methyltransferase domain-containing protein n=1 Tax=Paenibacillus foliorum TaxID=2654974 RepID=A0A972K2Y8_9BACL|nr:class I SAM-dependent methyltransferase [Paenibacillus foliorum]NOU95378.1 methyltransferase domain-containing protein [Paenibacillus foliorum]
MIKPSESIFTPDDVNKMLDSLLREAAPWWNEFYSDREKGIPFFVNAPDENLVQHFDNGTLFAGRVLELGCGPGRNAIYMAQKGCEVDAVDLSQEALNWAKERAASLEVEVQFQCANIFDLTFTPNSYDLIYDSGCLHHIAPHRRISYKDMIRQSLKPGGYFGLTCFVYGEHGAQITDWDVYRLRSLKGGLGYTEQKLRMLFHDFEVVELRPMVRKEQPNPLFGESFLWAALFQKR